MTNPTGAPYERLIADALQPYFPHADRLVKTGSKDRGDIGGLPIAIECKRVKKLNLSGALKEAAVEAENAGKPMGAVIHKRWGVGDPLKQYATVEVWALIELLLAYQEKN